MKLSTLIIIYTIYNRTLIPLTKINTRIIEPRNTYPPLFIPFFIIAPKKKKEKRKVISLLNHHVRREADCPRKFIRTRGTNTR